MTSPQVRGEDRGSLAYLCLEPIEEGRASYAHVNEIIAGLRRRGWRVRLYSPSYRSGARRAGLGVRLREVLRVQRRMWRENRTADALYVRTHVAAFPSTLWARAHGIPVVNEVNGTYEDLFIPWPQTRRIGMLVRWIWRLELRLASRVLAVTPGLAERVRRESGSERVECVPNGVNIQAFTPDRHRAGSAGRPYAVFVGNLAAWQGIPNVLAAARSPSWPEELQLLVVGDGAERATVQAAADGDRIVYGGHVAYTDVPAIVAGAVLSLSVQNNLGQRSATGLFPLKVFESMASGVPVIVSDFAGQADLVRETGCGLVVPPEDPGALANAVATLYSSPELRAKMGRVGRDAAESGHSWDARAGRVDEVLTTLVGDG